MLAGCQSWVFVVVKPSLDSIPEEHHYRFHVNADQAGCRLDHFLMRMVPGVSRSQLNDSVRSGLITVDDQPRKPSYSLKTGEWVVGSLSVTRGMELCPEKIPFTIVFEDPHLLVLSKPPGLVVHPGCGNQGGTLANGLLYHCAAIAEVGDDAMRPGIVHRLDKDTSGLMVVAKQEATHRKLVEAFQARTVDKQYLAMLHGFLEKKTGRLVAAIGRHPVQRQKMAVRESGRYAVTAWEVLQEFSAGFSLVRLHIETGRTHQIRVHMASIGHPVAGDLLYGRGRGKFTFPRQMLHSAQLRFIHPVTEEKLCFSAPLWPDFALILGQLADEIKG